MPLISLQVQIKRFILTNSSLDDEYNKDHDENKPDIQLV